MKNLFKNLLIIAAAAMTFSACQNQPEQITPNTGYELTIVAPNSAANVTKTAYDATAQDIIWTEGDEMEVLINASYSKVVAALAADGSATFTCSAGIVAGTNKVQGFYPSSAWVSTPKDATNAYTKVYGLTLPAAQTITETSFDKAADILIAQKKDVEYATATSQTVNFQFGRVGAITKYVFNRNGNSEIGATEKVATVEVEVVAGADNTAKNLAGKFYFDADINKFVSDKNATVGSEAVYTDNDNVFFGEGTNKVTLSYSTQPAVDNFTAWAITSPVTLKSGDQLKFTITTDAHVITKTVTCAGDMAFVNSKLNTATVNLNTNTTVAELPAQPTTATFTFANMGLTAGSGNVYKSFTADENGGTDITLTATKGTTDPTYYNDGWRIYKTGGTLTVAGASAETTITKIVFEGSSLTAFSGSGYTSSSATWEGSANSVLFTVNANFGPVKITKITVYYSSVALPIVSVTPTSLEFIANGESKTVTATPSNFSSTPTIAVAFDSTLTDKGYTSSVSENVVTIVAPMNSTTTSISGTATITATYGDETASIDVAVSQVGQPSYDITLTSVTVADSKNNVYIPSTGGSIQFKASSNYQFFVTKTESTGYAFTVSPSIDNMFADGEQEFTVTTANTNATTTDVNIGKLTIENDQKTVEVNVILQAQKQSGSVTDVLTASLFTATSSTYKDFSGVSATSSALYAGNAAKNDDAIQLRSKSNSGIVTTVSGGKVKKVVVTWNSSTTSGRTLDIYGSNTAYTAVANLYNTDAAGTKVGSIVYGTSTEYTFTADYTYIGLRSYESAMYIDTIEITYEN